MLRLELVVDAGQFFETYDSLGVERILEFEGRVVSPEERFTEIEHFRLSIRIKNSRSDVLGSGQMNTETKDIQAEVFLTQADVQNLTQLLPSLSTGQLVLSFFIVVDNHHEVFDERKSLDNVYQFHINQLVKTIGYQNH
ncbi:hypothetical protein [Hydrogenovibrio kuenenii]|uniref:hypothetical protein n=1 Tax=Hydrogenovibrio kuenenii TaxID=63658 RepID=UPI000463C2D7|nr:hypothetical protein [Hydrogenovibrio kuenenii]